MKDQRQPTTLERLEELTRAWNGVLDDETDLNEAGAWLTWTYNFLSARKQYHKKRQLTQALMMKMAKTLLSPDEITRVEQEAEDQLVGKLEEDHDEPD